MSATAIEELKSFQETSSLFRDMINDPRRHYNLFKRPKDFNTVCSAMDIIDDILYALNSYAASKHADQGLAYLEIFGVLQGLYVQQDAIRKLYLIITGKEIDLNSDYPDIKVVRDIRTRVAGHPVTGNGASHFLVRYTVSKWGFKLWEYHSDGNKIAKSVNLFELIQKSVNCLNLAMNKLIDHMNNEDTQHKKKFVNEPISEIFSNSTYFCGKISEGVVGRNPMGMVGLNCIKDTITNFKLALDKRSTHYLKESSLADDINILEYAFGKYEQYLNGDDSQSENDGHILASFIYTKVELLTEIAKDIDDEYIINE